MSSFVHVLDASFSSYTRRKRTTLSSARVGRYPKLLVTGPAGEILSKTYGFKAQCCSRFRIDPHPKDEHFKIGSAERAICGLDCMIACNILDSNLPPVSLDFGGEHCSLLNAVTQSCPTDDSITIYEAETNQR